MLHDMTLAQLDEKRQEHLAGLRIAHGDVGDVCPSIPGGPDGDAHHLTAETLVSLPTPPPLPVITALWGISGH